MTRTRPTRTTPTTPTTGITPQYGTSSGTNSEEPQDVTDVAQLDIEIPRGPTRPPGGGFIQPKPQPRSPIGVEIGKSAGGGLGIVVAVPLGGGPISGRGGISLGAGGAIKGGSVGLGVGIGPIGGSIDVGVDQDEEGRGGCYQFVTISVGFFSHTYGRNVCEPKSPSPSPSPSPVGGGSPSFTMPALDPNCSYDFFILGLDQDKKFEDCIGYTSSESGQGWSFKKGNIPAGGSNAKFGEPAWDASKQRYNPVVTGKKEVIGIVEVRQLGYPRSVIEGDVIKGSAGTNTTVWDSVKIGGNITVPFVGGVGSNDTYRNVKGDYAMQVIPEILKSWPYKLYWDVEIQFLAKCPGDDKPKLVNFNPDSGNNSSTFSPSISNPPPTKKKMDDKCCKTIMLMLLMQHRHLGVTPIPGMESLNQVGVKQKGETFENQQMAFPFEVPKRWLDPLAKKEDKILVKNLNELLFIMGSQSERLERVVGTKEFIKDSEGKLRQSEGNALSWLSGKNPDFAYPDPNDFWLNTDDGIINEKRLEVRSLADAVRYVVEMGNRLERILPIAELKNSTIPARWVYPGKKGQLKVGNLIHLIEYMFRADDRARGFWPQTVTIKDSNPAVKGDQKIELKFESQADMLREILKFLIDTEGDGDVTNNFALRSAIQQCQMHQLAVQNNAMLDAIVEYMDFKIEKTSTKVPMPFSPFAGHEPNLFDKLLTKLGFGNKQIPGSIDKNTEEAVEALFEGVLQNTEVKVPIVKANEKKSMSEAFLEILKHASAASAAVSERATEGALKRLVESAGIAQAVSRYLLKRDIVESNGIGDLDKWINSAETGYTDKPETQSLRFPESNPLEPYDRRFSENPKIQEIDTKDPKAD